jgi:hypothetical protein
MEFQFHFPWRSPQRPPKSSTGTLTKHCVQKNDQTGKGATKLRIVFFQVAHVRSVLTEQSTLGLATSIQKSKMEFQLNGVIASSENR